MTTPQEIPLRRPGDPILSAAENTALIRAARKDYDVRKGVSNDGDSLAGKDSVSPFLWLLVIATEAIPPYSIFSIANVSDNWDPVDPKSHTKKIVDTSDLILVTNEDDALIVDSEYYLPAIDFSEPRLLTYDPADGKPTIGQSVGPKPGTYTLSVLNEGLVAVSEPDTVNSRVWVLRHDKDTQSTAEGLFIVSPKEDAQSPANAVLQPGGEVQGYIYTRDFTNTVGGCPYTPDTQAEITILDALGQNCVFNGELVKAEKKQYVCDSVAYTRYEVVGSHGLRRKGKVAEAAGIECGATGAVNVAIDSTVTPQLMPFLSTNEWGYKRDTRLHDEVIIEYDTIKLEWTINESSEPIHATANLNENMCGNESGDEVQIGGFQTSDRYLSAGATSLGTPCGTTPGTFAPTTAYNRFELNGRNGDLLELRRNINFPPTSYQHWEIVEVKHHRKQVVTSGSFGTCSLNLVREWQSQQDCGEVASTQVISGTGMDVVTGMEWNAQLCKYTPKTTSVCVLNVGAAGQDGTPLQFTKRDIVINVVDNTGNLGQQKINAGVVCISSLAEQSIVDYTNCP